MPTAADVAALLAAQQVAGAADLQVARRDAEAGAEVRELAQGGQALPRLLGEDAVLGHQEVAVGELVAPPHPAAELVELREAEAVGAVDDHGVDVRDVDAVLDDRRGEQHVEVAAGEGVHAAVELLLVELAVADGHPHAGDDLACSWASRSSIDSTRL